MRIDLGHPFYEWELQFYSPPPRPYPGKDRHAARAAGIRLSKAGDNLPAKGHARPTCPRIFAGCRSRDRKDFAGHARPCFRALHQQLLDESVVRTGLVTRRISMFYSRVNVENR